MNRQPSRLALSLLQRYVPDSEALAGDIVEKFAEQPSQCWLWSQVFSAVARAVVKGNGGEIRPLQLVDQQPADAIERTLALHRRPREISPTANPLPAGLGLVILAGLVTVMAPMIWLGMLVTFAGSIALAWFLVSAHKRRSPSVTRRLT